MSPVAPREVSREMFDNDSQRVIVGMSGGVDSAVAALLLIEQGYQVEGLFMKNWEEDDEAGHCGAQDDLKDAQTVCNQLDIHLHKANFSHEYWEQVFQKFLAEYQSCRTPNPDILCNKEIKFKTFLEHGLGLGANLIATGHYARNELNTDLYFMRKGIDKNKDQTYFLYTLGQKELAHSLFPLGTLSKVRVREIARTAGFNIHSKKDSTGICFIGERQFRSFISRYLTPQPGDITTLTGKIIGRHQGLMYYTIGQRQGLGIGGHRQGTGEPWYVAARDKATNRLIVVQGHDHPKLFHRGLYAEQPHWIGGQAPELPYRYTARIRYRQSMQACRLERETNGTYRVIFEQPQWAIAPGQAVVFYQNDVCLGGGIISHVFD